MNGEHFGRAMIMGTLLALATSLITIAPFLLRLRGV